MHQRTSSERKVLNGGWFPDTLSSAPAAVLPGALLGQPLLALIDPTTYALRVQSGGEQRSAERLRTAMNKALVLLSLRAVARGFAP